MYIKGNYSSEICDCDKRNSNKIIYEDHNTTHHYTLSNVSNRTKSILLSKLKIDLKLYEMSLAYFKYEIIDLEFQSGIKFLCE